jgi:hypothetical protein
MCPDSHFRYWTVYLRRLVGLSVGLNHSRSWVVKEGVLSLIIQGWSYSFTQELTYILTPA